MIAAQTATTVDAEQCHRCAMGQGQWQESAPGYDTLYCTTCGHEWTIAIDEPRDVLKLR